MAILPGDASWISYAVLLIVLTALNFGNCLSVPGNCKLLQVCMAENHKRSGLLCASRMNVVFFKIKRSCNSYTAYDDNYDTLAWWLLHVGRRHRHTAI